MCLSTAYRTQGNEQSKLAEYVSSMVAEGEKITLTDIMGTQTVVYGTVRSIDLVKNTILIEGADKQQ